MTPIFRMSSKQRFYGRVIDGPFEGQSIENDEPFFEAIFVSRIPGVAAYTGHEIPSASIQTDRVLYKWLHGYRAWAWVQPVKWKGDADAR